MNANDKAWKAAKKTLVADMKVQRKTSGKINMGRSIRVAREAFKVEMPEASDEVCDDLACKLYISVI